MVGAHLQKLTREQGYSGCIVAMTQARKISAIILTYDSYAYKGGCVEHAIASVLNQTYADLEIIIVDNNTCPSPLYQAMLEGSTREWKIVNTYNNRSVGRARNLGAGSSAGDILIFLDEDTIICADTIFATIAGVSDTYSHGYGARRYWTYPPKHFERHAKQFLTRVKAKDYGWLLDSRHCFLPQGIDRLSGFRDLLEFTFPANFGFVTRRLFDAVGGFDERFKASNWEDDYLAYKLFRADGGRFKLLYDELSVLHVNHPMVGGYDNPDSAFQCNQMLYQALLKEDGIESFNINVLFGIPEVEGEPILDFNKSGA